MLIAVKPKPMATKRGRSSRETLRSKAEKILSKHPKRTYRIPEKDAQKLIHELEIHQFELEAQNNELRIGQAEIEEIRNRYVDLYDFAPVGYFTFDQRGKIVEANLTGAHFLGLPRSRLIGMPFTFFVEDDFKDLFHAHLRKVFSSELVLTCELKIRQKDTKSSVHVSLQSIAIRSGGAMRCRSAAIDITERKLAEKELLKARQELVKTNDRLRYLSERLLMRQEEERRRIALEVHDGFASSLSAIKYRLQDIPRELKNQYNFEELSNQLEVAIGEARRIQASLHPSALDDLGIVPALNWYCREFQENYAHINIEKQFQLGGNHIPDLIKIAIYRITQEALNNTLMHSKANSVSLSLTKKDGSINLLIQDNGHGFDVETVLSAGSPQRSFGLSSMKERAALSGGSFDIKSASGKGTTIRVSWPTPHPPLSPAGRALG